MQKENQLKSCGRSGVSLTSNKVCPCRDSSYINQQLITGEHLIYKCKIHWQIWINPCIWTILWLFLVCPHFILIWNSNDIDTRIIFVRLLLSGLPLILIWLCAYMNFTGTELAITDKRVICKFGFICRKAYEINLDKVEGVALKQSFLGRIFDCASISIYGTGSSSAPVPYIEDFREFKQQLLVECEKYKNKC